MRTAWRMTLENRLSRQAGWRRDRTVRSVTRTALTFPQRRFAWLSGAARSVDPASLANDRRGGAGWASRRRGTGSSRSSRSAVSAGWESAAGTVSWARAASTRSATAPKQGICGATAETIVARNLLRHICSGTAAHSDHARDLIHALLLAAAGTSDGLQDQEVRRNSAGWPTNMALPATGRSDGEVAGDVARFLLAEFGRQEGVLANTRRAPDQQQKNWTAEEATPRGIDREVVTGMHATHVGGDNDPEHILMAAARTALADGWGGSMIATDVSDMLFGEPHPLKSRVNLGVLKADEVNIIVHGHEPTLSDVIVAAARDPQLLAEAQAKGAKGINLAGICCTANEILMRHGVPIAGNFLQQELAVMTGAVDVMLVDIQCVFPALDAASGLLPHEGDLHQRQGPLLRAPCTSSFTKRRRWRLPSRSSASPSRISPSGPRQGQHPQGRKSRWWPALPRR